MVVKALDRIFLTWLVQVKMVPMASLPSLVGFGSLFDPTNLRNHVGQPVLDSWAEDDLVLIL